MRNLIFLSVTNQIRQTSKLIWNLILNQTSMEIGGGCASKPVAGNKICIGYCTVITAIKEKMSPPLKKKSPSSRLHFYLMMDWTIKESFNQKRKKEDLNGCDTINNPAIFCKTCSIHISPMVSTVWENKEESLDVVAMDIDSIKFNWMILK